MRAQLLQLFFLIIFMKVGGEEALLHSQQTFSLRSIGNKKNGLTISHDFSPIICPKTLKTISTVPTFCFQSSFGFQTKLDIPGPILRLQHQQPYGFQYILRPKPPSQYCQVCKQKFNDYMKHISHPLHSDKIKELNAQLNFNSLKEILKRNSSKRERKVVLKPQQKEQIHFQKFVQRDDNLEMIQQKFSIGSKKRIILNNQGDMQVISLLGSTKVMQLQGELSPHKSFQRISISRQQKV